MAGSPKSGKGGPVNLLKPSPRSKGADSAKGCAKCRHALTGCARCNPKKLAKYLDKKRRRAEEEGLDPEQVKLPCWASRGTAKAEGKRNKGPRSGASEGKKKKKRRKKVQVSRAPEGTKKRKKNLPKKKKDEPKPKGGKVGVLWSPGHGKEGRFYYGRIVKYDEAKGLHQVCYDDGEVQWQDLRREDLDLSKFDSKPFTSRGWLAYEAAQRLVSSLRFGSTADLRVWLNSDRRPSCIPVVPGQVYKKDGFTTYEDFISPSTDVAYQTWTRLREYARGLDLNCPLRWQQLHDRGKLRPGAPRDPDAKFSKYWISWCDFLGAGRFDAFVLARDFASGLGLTSEQEWREYCEYMKMPATVPSNPHEVYEGDWEGWADFLSLPVITLQDVWNGREGGRIPGEPKRIQIHKPVTRAERCGRCHTCLNPRLKQACLTVRRARMEEQGKERLEPAGA